MKQRSTTEWASAAAVFFAVGAIGELVWLTEVVSRLWFPRPSAVVGELVTLFGNRHHWAAIADTVAGWAGGLAAAALLAVPLGQLIGRSDVARAASRWVVEALRPIPSIALIPLTILLLGAGFETKFFLATFAAFWPLLIHSIAGASIGDARLVETADSLALGRLERLGSLSLPAALPQIAIGLRVSSSIALLLSVTAELVIGIPGLGREIGLAQSGGDTAGTWALIVTCGIIGMILAAGVERATAGAVRWREAL